MTSKNIQRYYTLKCLMGDFDLEVIVFFSQNADFARFAVRRNKRAIRTLASYAEVLLARHAIFSAQLRVGEKRLCDEPKEPLHRRLHGPCLVEYKHGEKFVLVLRVICTPQSGVGLQ